MAHLVPRALSGRIEVIPVKGVVEWPLKLEVRHPDIYEAGTVYLNRAEAEQLVLDLQKVLVEGEDDA